jgi:phospholipid/cholesterol/gamma-HCH transport system ATP-binding protein
MAEDETRAAASGLVVPERKVYARLENVGVRYGPKVVMQNLSLDIVEGAITCIIGLSGAGKSTILRLLNGLRKPDSGKVFVKGEDLSLLRERELIPLRQKIGFSFQFAALFDSLTIFENVALPLREHTKLSEREIAKIVTASLESVGLPNVGERMPAELSGGMVKRAGFARAVITDPEIVLYDEPTTGLDPIITHLLTDLIVRLRTKLNGTAVVVSHDLESIYAMADYVAMLFEGAIIAYGTVDELRASMNPIVQQFLQGSEVGPIPI